MQIFQKRSRKAIPFNRKDESSQLDKRNTLPSMSDKIHDDKEYSSEYMM